MRSPVELSKAYRLLNHGPTVLVSSAHAGRSNVMAAAWSMPLDFDPPKVAVVIDKSTYTRELIEASGSFALNVPTRALLDATNAVGNRSGRDEDKFVACALGSFAAERIAAPLVEGCVGWLECRVLPEPEMARKYDLFLGEVIAAWADERVFSRGRWHFDEQDDDLRSIHHVAGGAFFATGEAIKAQG